MDDEVLKRIVAGIRETKMPQGRMKRLEKAADRQRIVDRAQPLSEVDDFAAPLVNIPEPEPKRIKGVEPADDPEYEPLRKAKREKFMAALKAADARKK